MFLGSGGIEGRVRGATNGLCKIRLTVPLSYRWSIHPTAGYREERETKDLQVQERTPR